MWRRGGEAESGMVWTLRVVRGCEARTPWRCVAVGSGRFTVRNLGEHGELAGTGVAAPARDFVERAVTAAAKAALVVHYAHIDARRGDLVRHHAAWRFDAMARAARDSVGRPSTPQMNSPAAISRSRSTPVSMPMPSSM